MANGDTELDLLEPGTHIFTGKVIVWDQHRAEIWTDSGFAVQLVTQGQTIREGTHVTVVARRYRPRYHIVGIRRL